MIKYVKTHIIDCIFIENIHNVCYILIQGNQKDKSGFRQLG